MFKKIGALKGKEESCAFRVWAPFAEKVLLCLKSPGEKIINMNREEYGYWHVNLDNCQSGTRYLLQVDNNKPLPDPASLSQPEGVHAPSEVIDLSNFPWTDKSWQNIPLEEMIFYELHTGTFSEDGNFRGVEQKLDYLTELGINTIELMPVGQFPGKRNWGYDGVYPFAVQNSYGGPEALMRLVNSCHERGFAVVLDVIYNHLGPEGNYLGEFGPYFTDRYKTPWGQAINYDDSYADGVINYVVQNALMWLQNYHIDGLRLDAIHAIYDFSAKHIMHELAEQVKKLNERTGKRHYLIAESALNDSRYINSRDNGGYGLDCQWSDDFHHALHSLVTGENNGYYIDFTDPAMLSKAYTNAFVYDGQYSEFRKRHFGNTTVLNTARQFVVFSQNHDQVGNRKNGDRLSSLVTFEVLKVIAGAVFVSPYLPMLFMGEEYGETNPFLYFVDHNDKKLNELVRKGRQEEFKSFYPGDETLAPDPSDPETFRKSRLKDNPLSDKQSKALFLYYQSLINLKKTHQVLKRADRQQLEVEYRDNVFSIERWNRENRIVAWLNFSNKSAKRHLPEGFDRTAKLVLNSAEKSWGGPDHQVDSHVFINQDCIIPPETMLVFSISDVTTM